MKKEILDSEIHEDPNKKAFHAWAFGDPMPNRSELMASWNSRHGHLLTLEPDGVIHDDYPKMLDLWLAHKADIL